MILGKINFGILLERPLFFFKIDLTPSGAPDDILSQPIWHNEKIKIGGNPIFLNRWVKSEVFS